MEIDCTVVMPVLNLRQSIELVLRCLEAQSHPADRFECIVIDDGSTDGTRQFLETYSSSLQLMCIFNSVNQGRGAARNAGWKQGRGRIVAFLDGDNLPSPGWVSGIVQAFSGEAYDVVSGQRYCITVDPKQVGLIDRIAALAAATPGELFRKEVVRQFESLHRHARFGTYPISAFETFDRVVQEICQSRADSIVSAYSFVSCNVAVDRKLLAQVGGFDEFLRRAEDTDLGFRLWLTGARFGYAEGAYTYHQYAAGEFNRTLDTVEAMGFFCRHPYRIVPLVYLWFVCETAEGRLEAHPAFANLHTLLTEGPAMSDLDVDRECRRLGQPPMPADCCHDRGNLIEYLSKIFGIPRISLDAYLSRATEHGLYAQRAGDQEFFDLRLTSNWLRSQAGVLENIFQNTASFQRKSSMRTAGAPDAGPGVVRYRGTYEIAVDSSSLSGFHACEISNIPLPVENEAQRGLRFIRCAPPDLLAHIDGESRMIRHYPCPAGPDGVRVAYEFECEVREIAGEKEKISDQKPLSSFLRPLVAPRDYPGAKAILRKINAGKNAEPVVLARRIYDWIQVNVAVYESPEAQNNILSLGFGSCRDRSRLFVNLCRMAMIPARERCGILLSWEAEDSWTATGACRPGPLAHTWAEYHISGHGWRPVDLCGCLCARWSLAGLRMPRPDLREESAIRNFSGREYYFGNLDPYRLYCGDDLNESPLTVECFDTRSPSSRSRPKFVTHSLTVQLLPETSRF